MQEIKLRALPAKTSSREEEEKEPLVPHDVSRNPGTFLGTQELFLHFEKSQLQAQFFPVSQELSWMSVQC